MPFNVDIYTHYSSTNTLEKRVKKARDARKFVVNSITRELAQSQYDVVGYISYDAASKDNFNRETLFILDELFYELYDADFSIRHNLEDEEGKGFDYSLGIRAREIAGLFNINPDVLVFIDVNAFVRVLTALESNDTDVVSAVMTLGLGKNALTPEDITFVEITLVDADTGDIIWRDNFSAYGKSVLSQKDINIVVKKLLKNLSLKTLQQNMSYVE